MLREDLTRRARSTFLGLLCWFNARRARDRLTGKRAQQASIPPGDLLTITLSESLEEARECLAELRERFELTIHVRERFTWVEWRNLSKYQEWQRPQNAPRVARESPAENPRAAPSVSDSVSVSDSDSGPNPKPEKDKEPPSPPAPAVCVAPAGGKVNGHRIAKTLMPAEFSDDDWSRLQRLTARDELNEAQLSYAWRTVYNWSHSGDKRKADWVLTTVNAIRAGWALKGF